MYVVIHLGPLQCKDARRSSFDDRFELIFVYIIYNYNLNQI